MTNPQQPDAGTGGERPGDDERAWLEHMLSFEDTPEGPAAVWIVSEDPGKANIVDRAEAYLDSGGELSRPNLDELQRMLGLMHNTGAASLREGLNLTDEARAARQAELDRVKNFHTKVRRLRHPER